MERALDKLVLLVLTAFTATLLPFSVTTIMGALLAISVVALFDVDSVPGIARAVLVFAYLVAGLFVREFLIFLPVVSYDCFRLDSLLSQPDGELKVLYRIIWVVPLAFGLLSLPPTIIVLLALLCVLACLRAWQSERIAATLLSYRLRRDELSALSQALELKNHDLEERQTLELSLATLAERSRIAREIHDNVGHLLTRSVLQVEALQVQHDADQQLTEQLVGITDTLREAYSSVRQSVHSLHEEAFDLHLQLQVLAKETEQLWQNQPELQADLLGSALSVQLTYELTTDPPPQSFSYTVLAIVREALANTMKHSNATTVQISLMEFPGFYQLIVHDNGSLEPSEQSLHNTRGIGLVNMQERTRSLGGVLNTSWDHGFKVFASFPKEV